MYWTKNIENVTIEQITGPKEPWQQNKRCIDSLFNGVKLKMDQEKKKQ